MATSGALNNEPVASDAKADMKFEVIFIPCIGWIQRVRT